jgi:hypothetical protein
MSRWAIQRRGGIGQGGFQERGAPGGNPANCDFIQVCGSRLRSETIQPTNVQKIHLT